jgi:hypothetical protein
MAILNSLHTSQPNTLRVCPAANSCPFNRPALDGIWLGAWPKGCHELTDFVLGLRRMGQGQDHPWVIAAAALKWSCQSCHAGSTLVDQRDTWVLQAGITKVPYFQGPLWESA